VAKNCDADDTAMEICDECGLPKIVCVALITDRARLARLSAADSMKPVNLRTMRPLYEEIQDAAHTVAAD
jgi:hypothetical protein